MMVNSTEVIDGEEWRPVMDFGGVYADRYEVSNMGRVKSLRGRSNGVYLLKGTLKGATEDRRYLGVGFWIGVNCKQVQIHRLVASAFVGPIPDGMHVNHKNGIKTDNRAENLEIITPSDHRKHTCRVLGYRNVCGEGHHKSLLSDEQVDEIKKLLTDGELTHKAIGLLYGVSRQCVQQIRSGARRCVSAEGRRLWHLTLKKKYSKSLPSKG